jgi:hypothetical protein
MQRIKMQISTTGTERYSPCQQAFKTQWEKNTQKRKIFEKTGIEEQHRTIRK